jgi:hypothetical protein
VDYWKDQHGTIDMPSGIQIFETVGPWEDFSTPGRDMRLLIAIDTVQELPARVARRPQRYGLPAAKAPAEVRAELEQQLGQETRARRFAYGRSDGSHFELSLADVIARAPAFEVAYNPNDCPEIRWGAPEGSDELSTCKRRAPKEQRARVEKLRTYWAQRKRPPR